MDVICNLPVYMMNTLEDASRCGGKEGKMAAIVGTLIASFFFIVLLASMRQEEQRRRKTNKNYQTKTMSYVIILLVWFTVIVLIWLLVPNIVKGMKEMSFQENELMINNLVKGGMTKQAAKEQVIQQRQAEAAIAAQEAAARRQERATRRAAERQASATDRQTNALVSALNRK